VGARKGSSSATREGDESLLANQLRRANNLLALLLVKGESQPEKIRVLSAAGYSNTEIADLLGVTANVVNVALYRQRSKN
jgi:DNA-binding CsgD family transcriptional regulator